MKAQSYINTSLTINIAEIISKSENSGNSDLIKQSIAGLTFTKKYSSSFSIVIKELFLLFVLYQESKNNKNDFTETLCNNLIDHLNFLNNEIPSFNNLLFEGFNLFDKSFSLYASTGDILYNGRDLNGLNSMFIFSKKMINEFYYTFYK